MGFLSPKDTSYLKYYTKQSDLVVEGATLLSKIVEAKSSAYSDIAQQMRLVEGNSEAAKLDSVRWISNTFVTPYDRSDMYILSSRLDDIVDEFDKAIDIIHLFQIDNLPEKAAKEVKILGSLATCFSGIINDLATLRKQVDEVDKARKLVAQAEKAHRNLLAKLFKNSSNAKEIIKIKSLIDVLNSICASFENLVSIVESITIKES
jgi:uncharacterized protein Yka (UPF0111/DUF47 family)